MGRAEARALREQMAGDPTEAEMLIALTAAARDGGWTYHHTQRSDYGRQMGLRGFPDLILVHPRTGKLIALEVKARRGILTPEQEHWLSSLGHAGAHVAVVWPADLDFWVKRLNESGV